MRKELFRKGSPLTKATAAVLSLTLAFGMTPALAFAQPTNEGGGNASIDATTLETDEPAENVPENLQLSELNFVKSRFGELESSNLYTIEGGFDAAKAEVTVCLNADETGFAILAKLGASASGNITADYIDTNGQAQTEIVGSDGVGLGLLETNNYEQKDITIKVGGTAAYIVHVKKRATLSSVTMDGALFDDTKFNKNTYEYNVDTARESFTVNATASDSAAVITGAGTVTPAWDSNDKADVSVTVADKDQKGVASTYVFHVQHYDKTKAQAVVNQINDIGEVTLDKEPKITEARAAYNALPAVLQAEVTNLSTLEDAELALSNLKYPTDNLESVIFGSGSSESDPQAFYMEPVSSTSMRDYNVYMSNNAAGIYTVIATAKASYSDAITVTYTNTFTNSSVTETLTSGKRYWPNGMISSAQYSSAKVLVNANGQLYRYTIYRVASLASLSLISASTNTQLFNSDSGLGDKPGQAFSANVTPGEELSATCTYGSSSKEGTATVSTPVWNNRKAQVTISAWAGETEGVKPYLAFVTLNETPSKIEVTKAPTKTEYKLGENFDSTGMEVTATYADGGTAVVTASELTCTQSDLNTITVNYNGATTTQAITTSISFPGSGTQEDPYVLSTTDHMKDFAYAVNHGKSFEGEYVELGTNVELSTSWTPAGCLIDESLGGIKKGENLNAFSGSFDGKGHTLTVPSDEKALFGYVKGATIKNLKLYGKKISGNGLIVNMAGVGLSGTAVIIDNVTILSGTTITGSGFYSSTFLENAYSGVSYTYESTIKNCTIEKGVIIGKATTNYVGSFAGRFQGTIENCESYATVKGKNYVGGIIGSRDNAMGNVTVKNCKFHGEITTSSSGVNAGGIVGGTYDENLEGEDTSPNGQRINIINNYCDGTIKGKVNVGGILGGDHMVAQAWNDYEFSGNVFCGDIARGNADSTGAIIGYYRSLNKHDNISNNSYKPNCSSVVENIKAIGTVDYVDTNNAAIVAQFDEGENSVTIDGTLYFNTEKNTKGCPEVKGCSWQTQKNRTDDPLGVDSSALFSEEEPAFKVSTVASSEAGTSIVKVGDTFTVNVVASGNYNITALSAQINYDAKVLKLASVSQGADLSSGAILQLEENAAGAKLSFSGNEASTTGEEGAVIATATFKALVLADSSSITVTEARATTKGDSNYYEATPGEAAAMSVIANATLGDVNNSGKINIVDAQVVYDMATEEYGKDYANFPLPDGWNKATLIWAANVNADDAVDATDALAIQYYALHGTFGKTA